MPKRAFQYPLLAFSILAFSSLDWCLTTGTDDEWSSTYYSHALQILIPVLNGPIETLDENVLAGIVLLRLYEEISGNSKVNVCAISSKGGSYFGKIPTPGRTFWEAPAFSTRPRALQAEGALEKLRAGLSYDSTYTCLSQGHSLCG